MKLKLLFLLAAGIVAMGPLLSASITLAQTEHLPAIYGLVLDEDAEATFPVTPAPAPAPAPAGGGGGGGGSDWCLISTVAYEFGMLEKSFALVLLFGILLVGLLELRRNHKK